MTQYLVTTFKDSIGHVHPHVTAAKPNQTFTVVEAESKEEALERYRSEEEFEFHKVTRWDTDSMYI